VVVAAAVAVVAAAVVGAHRSQVVGEDAPASRKTSMQSGTNEA
jgi:hypothetical protein